MQFLNKRLHPHLQMLLIPYQKWSKPTSKNSFLLLVQHANYRVTSHVEWEKLKSPNGFTPSGANPNLMLWALTTNYNQFFVKCFQFMEFGMPRIRLSKLAPFLRQTNNSTKYLHLYIFNDCGIDGKCPNTFCGTRCELSTNLLVLHFGHNCEF
jgi:hypothetical protein